MSTKKAAVICSLIFCVAAHATALAVGRDEHHQNGSRLGPLVRRDERRTLVSTQYGEVSAVEIGDGGRGRCHLQLITLEPNALFLPALLHADMVFYVQPGSGTFSWVDDEETKRLKLKKGDVYRLQSGTVFFLQSSLEPERQKLRLHAIFTNSIEDLHEPFMLAYSSIYDLILGFDKRVLRSAFKASEEVIAELTNGTKPPSIVHAVSEKGKQFWDFEAQFMKGLLGSKGYSMLDVSNKKFENCNGWSLTVTKKDLSALKGSNVDLFMVNLTKGSMMGPHWNPMATEISIVLQGRGMIRVVCPSWTNESECRNVSFLVEQDDVFAVPRFHPMAQMAFNNDSLVFVGFSTATNKNHPQYLAGKASVLRTLDREIVAASLNVVDEIVDRFLDSQDELVILDCTSCAEEEAERAIGEARKREEKEKQEEEKRKEEEEARKRKLRRKRKKGGEKRKRKKEGKRRKLRGKRKKGGKKRKRKKEEEEPKTEEEERRKQKEKARQRKEEEERRREEEEEEEAEEREEAKRKEEERRRREEEKATKREEKEAKRREKEQRRREEARKREEEEEERGLREGEAEEEEEVRRQGKSRRERKRQQEEEGEEESEGGGWREMPRKILKKIWRV